MATTEQDLLKALSEARIQRVHERFEARVWMGVAAVSGALVGVLATWMKMRR